MPMLLERKALVSAIHPQHDMAALNADYSAWTVTVFGLIYSNLTIIFNPNYFSL